MPRQSPAHQNCKWNPARLARWTGTMTGGTTDTPHQEPTDIQYFLETRRKIPMQPPETWPHQQKVFGCFLDHVAVARAARREPRQEAKTRSLLHLMKTSKSIRSCTVPPKKPGKCSSHLILERCSDVIFVPSCGADFPFACCGSPAIWHAFAESPLE